MEERICGTPITGSYVSKHLRKALNTDAELSGISGQLIAIGHGFASHILRLQLDWKRRNDQKDLPETVVVKTPTVSSIKDLLNMQNGDNKQMSAIEQLMFELHRAECQLYEMLKPRPPIPMALCYVGLPLNEGGPGMLVLEDMSSNGGVLGNIAEGLTLGQVLDTVAALAKLHGWCLTTSVDWKKTTVPYESRKDMFDVIFKQLFGSVHEMKEVESEYLGDLDLDQITEWTSFDKFLEINYAHRELNIPDVIVHGDLWANNIMYCKNKDGKLTDKVRALIDFQICHIGGPCSDIARLLLFSVKTQLRKDHLNDILRHYYNELKAIVGHLTFDLDDLKTVFRKHFAFQGVQMILALPILKKLVCQDDKDRQVQDEREIKERVREAYDEAILLWDLV